MADTSIEWTEQSWNPPIITGCDPTSPGCAHCYAKTMVRRMQAMGNQPLYSNAFALTLHRDQWDAPAMYAPLKRKKPTMYFVNSMYDLFHKDVPFDYIAHVFNVMNRAPQHTFQVLTKRHEQLADLADKLKWTPNIWQGVSIENNRFAHRADYLRRVPAAVRFLSCEPLLGPLTDLDLTGIDWVIAGAESGFRARPMHDDWVRGLRDACQAKGVAFFFKQRAVNGRKQPLPELDGHVWKEFPIVRVAA